MAVNGQYPLIIFQLILSLFLTVRQTFLEPVSKKYYRSTELGGKLCGSGSENTFESCRSLIHCGSKCLGIFCFSFFYNKRSQQCVMSNRTYTTDATADCENSTDTVYYVIEYKEEYVGCFKDSGDRAMSGGYVRLDGATVDLCIERCRGIGTSYAGIQHGSACFCANEYAKHGPAPESDCNMACPGNSTQKCGGPWRNSVWKID